MTFLLAFKHEKPTTTNEEIIIYNDRSQMGI